MSSTISSSTADGTQEPPDLIDSRNPSRQTSYHESDVGVFSPQNYMWPLLPINPSYPIPHVQSLESIQTAMSAPSPLLSDPSSVPFYQGYSPLVPGDSVDSFAMAGAWTYASDTASVDLYHDSQAGIHRTDSTLSVGGSKRDARASFPVYTRSRSPFKGDKDRASRCRSIVGVVTPPADAGVKKSRKAQLRASSSRRNSMPFVSSGANARSSTDGSGRRHSPAKEEALSNDEQLTSEDEDSRNRPKASGKEPTFACPFYRRWPTRHIECMNRKLTRIQDVKQHIYRRHSKSPFYCPTCSKVFTSPDPRDEHIRAFDCKAPATAASKRSSDGISAQLQDSLKNRFSRKLNPVEQWYGIWELIFPDVQAPTNAHVGSIVTEMVGMLKDFWKNEGQRIMPSLVKPSPNRPIGDEDLQMLMVQMLDKVQDHFDGESCQVEGAATEPDGGQADQVMDNAPVDNKTGVFADDDENSYEQSPPTGWNTIFYSPDGSPTLNIGGRMVPPCTDFGSSGMLEQQPFTEQPWMAPVANPIVNGFQ